MRSDHDCSRLAGHSDVTHQELVARAAFAPASRGYELLVLSYATTAPQITQRKKMVRVAGVEPAWTCAQDMWVAATLHPDCGEDFSALSLFTPSRRPPGATCAPRRHQPLPNRRLNGWAAHFL